MGGGELTNLSESVDEWFGEAFPPPSLVQGILASKDSCVLALNKERHAKLWDENLKKNWDAEKPVTTMLMFQTINVL